MRRAAVETNFNARRFLDGMISYIDRVLLDYGDLTGKDPIAVFEGITKHLRGMRNLLRQAEEQASGEASIVEASNVAVGSRTAEDADLGSVEDLAFMLSTIYTSEIEESIKKIDREKGGNLNYFYSLDEGMGLEGDTLTFFVIAEFDKYEIKYRVVMRGELEEAAKSEEKKTERVSVQVYLEEFLGWKEAAPEGEETFGEGEEVPAEDLAIYLEGERPELIIDAVNQANVEHQRSLGRKIDEVGAEVTNRLLSTSLDTSMESKYVGNSLLFYVEAHFQTYTATYLVTVTGLKDRNLSDLFYANLKSSARIVPEKVEEHIKRKKAPKPQEVERGKEETIEAGSAGVRAI